MEMPILPSSIVTVTVFAGSGAEVLRQADLSYLQGRPTRVRIVGLPLCLDDASLRVEIDGAAVEAVDVTPVLDVPPRDAALAPAQDEALLAARTEMARLTRHLARCEERNLRLEAMSIVKRPDPPRGQAPADTPIEGRLALIGFVIGEQARLDAERRTLEVAMEETSARIARLEETADRASRARQVRAEEARKAALIALRWKDGTADGILRLRYRVPGASWFPSHVLRFDEHLSRVRMQMRAMVCQDTGEDWTGARLVFSTADALAWCELPELTALRIGRRQAPPAARAWRPAPADTAALYADFDAAQARMPEPEASPAKGMNVDQMTGAVPVCQASVPCPPAAAAPMSMACAPAEEAMEEEQDRSDSDSKDRERRRLLAGSCPSPAVKSRRCAAPGAPSPRPACPPPPPPRPDAMGPSQDLLQYQNLCLAGAEDRQQRGRLRPQPPVASLLTLVMEAQVTVAFDLVTVIQTAIARAEAVMALPLPLPGARRVRPGRHAACFPTAVPTDVLSDRCWHLVPVAQSEAAVDLLHVSVPREAREVFRQATFANPFPSPLPGGPVDCYRGEDFLVGAQLPDLPPGGTAELALGIEPAIAVARNCEFEESASGLLGNAQSCQHRVRVELANKLAWPVLLELRERLPVSDEKDCTVKLLDAAPTPEPPPDPAHPDQALVQALQPLAGGRRWRLTLEPGREKRVEYRYAIAFPAKQELVGGNRREP